MEEKAKIIANVRAQRAAVARLFQRRKEREEKRKEKEEKRTMFSRKSKENKVDSEVTELKQRLEKVIVEIQRKKPVAIHTSRQKDATLDPPLVHYLVSDRGLPEKILISEPNTRRTIFSVESRRRRNEGYQYPQEVACHLQVEECLNLQLNRRKILEPPTQPQAIHQLNRRKILEPPTHPQAIHSQCF
ncbi:hypothetical protein SAY86_027986 [Trapa natans]|uniref:Uncharacterized protein n=1 Tax=Trapa natans TaxID=22666 RepID=A0AAN7LYY6_TRANT|nr:hypothetical protein SAY86_027986 [Trapa natans]